MMPDPQNKNPRTFQCRDYLWDAFEAIAHEMDCTPDSIVNEAMRVYLQSKGRGGPMADIPEPLEPRAGGGFRPPNQNMGQQGMGQQGVGQQGMGGMQRPGMSGAPPPMGNQQRPGMPGAPPPMPGMPTQMQGQGQRPPMPPLNQGAPQGMSSQQGMQQAPRLPPLGGQPGGLPPMNPNAQRPQGGPGALPNPGAMMGQQRAPTQMPGAPSQMGAPMQQPMGQQGGMGAQRPMAPPPQQQQQQQHMPPPQQPMAPPQRPPQQQGRQGGTLVAIYEGQQYPVTKEEFVIGRGQKTSDLTIRDSNVSRRHACVVLYNGQYWIVDQQSTNGVEFNGVKVDKKVVEHGDLYRICDHEIQFVYR